MLISGWDFADQNWSLSPDFGIPDHKEFVGLLRALNKKYDKDILSGIIQYLGRVNRKVLVFMRNKTSWSVLKKLQSV